MNERHVTFDDQYVLYQADADEQQATEVLFGHIAFSDTEEVPPKYENGTVTKELPIMVEGEYMVLDRATKKYRKVTITKDDIEQYYSNTPRDVAVNYEHKRVGPNKGWVRLKDTGRIGILNTRSGKKTALFSRLELLEEARLAVQSGFFADVSIELKPASKQVTGLALTANPIMTDLQFFSNELPDEEETAEEETTEEFAEEETPVSPATGSNSGERMPDSSAGTRITTSGPDGGPPNSEEVPSVAQTEPKRSEQLREALLEFGITPEDIQEFKNSKAQADLIVARDRIKQLAHRDDGTSVLAPAGIDVAAQLLVFAQAHDEEVFSVDGENVNAEALIAELFNHINAVQLFGETEGVSAENLEAEPELTDPDDLVDEEKVKRLTAAMRSQINKFS